MHEIIESIINGQRKQALEQLTQSQFTLEDLFEEFLEQNMPQEIIIMHRVAINQGYLTFKE
jgi:hypothetical protein